MRQLVKKFIWLMFTLSLCAVLFSCGKKDKEEETTQDAGHIGENSSTEAATESKGYNFSVGSNWKYAYSDTEYDFYYMSGVGDTYDTNVILSITDDKALSGATVEEIVKSIKNMYGSEAHTEELKTKENGETVVYVETNQDNGEDKASLGQYIVLGEEKAVIFSVYAAEDKFETARKYAEYAVNSIRFEQ